MKTAMLLAVLLAGCVTDHPGDLAYLPFDYHGFQASQANNAARRDQQHREAIRGVQNARPPVTCDRRPLGSVVCQ